MKYIVQETIDGHGERLKEYPIGAEALGKGASFDPRADPIVRAEASRLRSRLERYYAADGSADPVTIVLLKGSYAPQFLDRKLEPEKGRPQERIQRSNVAEKLGWSAVGFILAGCIFAVLLWSSRRSAPVPEEHLIQFDVGLTSAGTIGGVVGTSVVISPDGSRVVFIVAGADGVPRLNTRRLDGSQPIALAGSEGARVPFFSPDGRWIGFSASGKLKKSPVEGGFPVVLCDAPNLQGASWGEDGNIIAALGGPALARVPDAGGTPSTILDLSKESATPMWPQILSGGTSVLYTVMGFFGPNRANVEALNLSTGKRTVLARGGTFGRYLSNSYLTYVNQGTLFALPIDLKRMEVRGPAIAIVDGIAYSSTFGFAELDFSRTGTMVYRKNNGDQVTAQWLDNSGKTQSMLNESGSYLWPRLSPDGKRLALSVTQSGESGIWIYEGPPERFTRLPTESAPYIPLWTPDGRYLILGSFKGLSWIRADGVGKIQPLSPKGKVQIPWSISPDGKRLAYHELSQSTGFDLWTVPIHESADGLTAGNPEPFLQSPAFETYPSFSPDGHWIAYGSNESGSWEIYVRGFPDNGTKVQVSNGGGRIARWWPGRNELLYRTDDQRLMQATYAIEHGSFQVQSVSPWSKHRLADTGVLSNFDLEPHGGRILALMPAGNLANQQENQVTFMLNFFSEVENRSGIISK